MPQTSHPTGQRATQKPVKFNDQNKLKQAPGFWQDDKEPHLYLRVSPLGKRVWCFYGQAPNLGKVVKKNLDQCDAEMVSVAAARAVVKEMDVGFGKKKAPSASGAPTLGYMVTLKGTPSLRVTFDDNFSDWEDKRLDELTAPMVVQRQAEILKRAAKNSRHNCLNPGAAAMSIAAKCLRTVYNYAFKKALYVGANAGKWMDTAPVTVRRERLEGAKRGAYDAVLNDKDNGLPEWARVFFKLLPETGSRWGHLIQARWSDIDLDACVYTVPATIAKNRKLNPVLLSDAAVVIFKAWRKESTGALVFPSESDDTKPVNNPTWWWYRIAKWAGLEGNRMHDLRRTFGFELRNKGVALEDISIMMNHSKLDITALHYAHPTTNHLLGVLNGARR